MQHTQHEPLHPQFLPVFPLPPTMVLLLSAWDDGDCFRHWWSVPPSLVWQLSPQAPRPKGFQQLALMQSEEKAQKAQDQSTLVPPSTKLSESNKCGHQIPTICHSARTEWLTVMLLRALGDIISVMKSRNGWMPFCLTAIFPNNQKVVALQR
jgi:hypothetical protein